MGSRLWCGHEAEPLDGVQNPSWWASNPVVGTYLTQPADDQDRQLYSSVDARWTGANGFQVGSLPVTITPLQH